MYFKLHFFFFPSFIDMEIFRILFSRPENKMKIVNRRLAWINWDLMNPDDRASNVNRVCSHGPFFFLLHDFLKLFFKWHHSSPAIFYCVFFKTPFWPDWVFSPALCDPIVEKNRITGAIQWTLQPHSESKDLPEHSSVCSPVQRHRPSCSDSHRRP